MTAHVARCGGELLRICPSLSAWVATTPAPTDSDDATERFSRSKPPPICWSRIAVARPLVLMLDDLQWADATTLLLLRHLARALAGTPVLLIAGRVATRAEQASDALRSAFADFDRGEARRLHLGGLAGNDSTIWCRQPEQSITRRRRRSPMRCERRPPGTRCSHRNCSGTGRKRASTKPPCRRASATSCGVGSTRSAETQPRCSRLLRCSASTSTKMCCSTWSGCPSRLLSTRSMLRRGVVS